MPNRSISLTAKRRSSSRICTLTAGCDKCSLRAAAEKLVARLEGRTVIVLGAAVRDALRLPPVLVKPVVDRGVVFRQLPHPSGRCRWYNDPKHRKVAGLLLEEEYERGRRS